ncbi:unnamed protein product [Rhizoctonia solani]|uniref:Peptidase C14 caspase domain-containing protein n=1 Tax=Rhizoctonia solani TaxID=456999 RepID=A0A8H3BSR6_9AGAM|nr:unnamed protein product [Rhizoctonia solani]
MSETNLDTKLPCEAADWEHTRAKSSFPNIHSELKDEAQPQAPQPEHETVQEEHDQHIPGAWIHPSPTVVSVPEPLDETSQSTLWEELGSAIRNGDSIPTSNNQATYKLRGEVKRRALLIGGQYETDSRNRFLPGTPNDIWNIYRMLLNHGYEKEDIRILMTRAEDTTQYKCRPTKNNIMKSLDWLVQNTRKGDYRYFHFSGHGEVFESSTGKEAREIPKQSAKVKKNDTELYGGQSVKTHVSQTIRATELKRYSEGMLQVYDITLTLTSARALSAYCRDKPPHTGSKFDLTEWENRFRVRDEELNEVFSRLPEGCNLTCTLDCCHSARIANNNFKLLGAGFRGSVVAAGNEPSLEPLPLPHIPPTTHHLVDKVEIKKGVILRNGSNDKPSCAVQISSPSQLPIYGPVESEEFPTVDISDGPESFQASRGLINFTTSVYQYFSPPRATKIKMEEKLPDEEARQDKIVADMLTWGGCHQRQFAGEFGDGFQKGGYFTSAFVEAVNGIPKDKPIKVRELFENVNKKLEEKMENCIRRKNETAKEKKQGPQDNPKITRGYDSSLTGGVRPQYIQLWTSLGNRNEDSARAKLDQFFDIGSGQGEKNSCASDSCESSVHVN